MKSAATSLSHDAARHAAAGRADETASRRGLREAATLAGLVVALAYYYAVPSPLLSLPGLIVFAALAWRRLDLALGLLPLTFPFWYVPKRVFGHTVFPLSEIALGVCVVVALGYGLRWLTRDDVPRRLAHMCRAWPGTLGRVLASWRQRASGGRASGLREVRAFLAGITLRVALATGAGLFVLGTAIGVLIARLPHEALRAWRWEVAEPLLYLALLLIFARRRETVRVLVWSFLAAAALMAALAAVQVFWLHATFTPLADGNRLVPYATATGGMPRATAFFYGSGNSLGAEMGRALPLAVALALAKGAISRRARALAALVGLACVPSLLWSQSRGAMLAAAIACVVVLCLALRRPLLLGGVALAATIVALWDSAALFQTALVGHGGSGEVRTLVWLAAWHMIRDHPLVGIGPDQFLYYYSNLYTSHPYWITVLNGHRTLAWREPNLAQPHNLLLDLWLSGGLLALAGFAVVLAAFWQRALALWRRVDGVGRVGGWTAAVALGVGGSVLAGVLHGMVDNGYFAPDLALAFWWAVAVVVLLARDAAPGR